MNIENRILSDITVFSKYAKYIPILERRESWSEICDRYEQMMVTRYPYAKDLVINTMQAVRTKKVLPSMRALQFAGPAVQRNPSRVYNCAYLPIDDYRAFSETMFLLLGGTGVGYSVQFHHVDKLPEIRKPIKAKRFLVGDSIEGWSDAVKVLMKAYFGIQNWRPLFDFSDVRPKGARLITAGGKAPGPEPLRLALAHMESILNTAEEGKKLTPLQVHDLVCHIANAVLAGGIRRAALISLFSFDDEDMITCKYGNWWELNEQRGRANNSAVIDRRRILEPEFQDLWKRIQLSGCGEPGIYFTNDIDLGTNPCCEISLKPFQFCNLTEVNVSDITDLDDLKERVEAATVLGTMQAGFTDFHYLRDIWKKTTEKDALIGVGMTGIASGEVLKHDLSKLASLVKKVNEETAKLLGVNPAARATTVKPSGTTSCVLGTSSGIHAWHAPYYLRTVRFNTNESIAQYLMQNHSELVEADQLRPHDTICVRIPIKAPKGAILRDEETALELMERVKRFNVEWVRKGHRRGNNTNNVSATISIKDHEWQEVGEWMWNNREYFNGLSVLNHDGGTYVQAPFEEITQEQYEQRMKSLIDIDLTKVIEHDDDTTQAQEAACAGGMCSVDF